jgi:hypothetical protein
MKRPIIIQSIVPVQLPFVVNNPVAALSGTIHIAPKPSTVTMTSSPTSSMSPTGHTAILPKTDIAPIAPAMIAAPSNASASNTQDVQVSASPMYVNANAVIAPRPAEPPFSDVPAYDDFSKISTVWYLGGNHIIKLLTSVDGDLDPSVLEKLASVPSVVGELALSVESLVSDDATVGGFENDLLAKIASNTLTGKRGSLAEAAAAAVVAAPPAAPQLVSRSSSTTSNSSMASSASTNLPQQQESSIQQESQPDALPPLVGNVPNPLLADYKPVPNPLARITPPASPNADGKRACSDDSVGPDTKRIRPTAEFTMIHAR